MDFSSQESIDAVTCPICQELLKEPMSLDCGHNFCQDCITAESESGNPLELECRCPVCQRRYQPWNLRINWQLAERVKKFREVDMSSQQPRRRDLCEHHGENYNIFCKDDGKAICRLCVQEHQGHQMSPIMEVAKECQERLQEALKKLSQEQQEAEQLEIDINEERATWKKHMQTERERILQGFEEIRGILDKEEQRELQKLEEDEVNVLDNLTVAKDQMVQQKQYMSELVSDLQRHMHESTIDMLQDVINTLRRCEIYTLKKPKIVSNKPKSTFRVPDLSGMLQKFKEICEPEEPQIRTDRSRGAAGMASGILVNIKEEVTCPICLELLTQPLSLDCGHTFCQACITANNTKSMVSEEGQSSCPVCRITYQSGNLRPNRHVANIVETLREVKLSPEEEQKTELCERHGEKLLIFCKEDGKFICWLCERSQEHRGHHTFLMEEVAQEYKNLIQNDSQSVQDYFKKLRGFLDTEEQKELQKLMKEKGDVLRDLEQSESELVQQSLVLRDLMSELECRLQGSMRKMLQDVNGIMER
ncbi:E3 ubiquitin-protein ligase TRIM22-like isoform X1 [Sturnira hondurensis]|uniref:E3 ubiquitin-protein ligase TRIM22-like isoform X1 n=1 Tax=Sturnira hondurensis TaxID=192404 RepID=UPI001879AC5F|nr:E3 ubiquitin-protein ligase TRIM22-like isoform X1 [Sturnira hondurensis]